MGGTGSGRRWHSGSRKTTDSYQAIDVRWLKREGMLSQGASRHIIWSRHEEIVASINVRAEPGCIILTYRHRIGSGEWKDKSYPVYLTTTPCHMGGERHWFLCPARGCGQRVAVIYGGDIFACRKCCKLAYASQRENAGDRVVRQTNRIRRKMGWPAGIFNGSNLGKPNGMHWRTYERLCLDHDILQNQILVGLVGDLKRLRGRDLKKN